MNLFYHVVGLKGSADFKKTVSKKWSWDEIKPHLSLSQSEMSGIEYKIKERLGDTFNIWGVPERCNTFKFLEENSSYVLGSSLFRVGLGTSGEEKKRATKSFPRRESVSNLGQR